MVRFMETNPTTAGNEMSTMITSNTARELISKCETVTKACGRWGQTTTEPVGARFERIGGVSVYVVPLPDGREVRCSGVNSYWLSEA